MESAGDFRNLRWGMAKADVLALEPRWRADGDHTTGEEELFGIPFDIRAEIGPVGLTAVHYQLRGALGPPAGYWAVMDAIAGALCAWFGPAELDELALSGDSTRSGERGRRAVRAGDGAWVKQWSVGGRTRVRLTLQRGMEDVDKNEPLAIHISYAALPRVMPGGAGG